MTELDEDNPNRPETEEEDIKAEALRRLRIRHLLKEQSLQIVPSTLLPMHTSDPFPSVIDGRPPLNDKAPENSLENATEYLAWAARVGMRNQ